MTKFTPGDWIRTCQECGYKQKATKPSANKELSGAYLEAKCRKCHSPALDYGKTYRCINEDDEE